MMDDWKFVKNVPSVWGEISIYWSNTQGFYARDTYKAYVPGPTLVVPRALGYHTYDDLAWFEEVIKEENTKMIQKLLKNMEPFIDSMPNIKD